MSRFSLSVLLTFTLTGPIAAPAFAHEFDLLLLAPAEASPSDLDNMRAAFLIASHERDNHPDETSEGHLGGMDVQLTLARIDEVDAGAAPDFVLAPFAALDDPQVIAVAAASDAVIVDQAVSARVAPEEPTDLAPFADRFLAETGRAADSAALAVYRAARVVDLVVRPLGSVDDRLSLRRALDP